MWSVAFGVGGVGVPWEGGTPNKRAAGGAGNVEVLAVELCDEFDDGRFTAAWAGTVELKEWLLEL